MTPEHLDGAALRDNVCALHAELVRNGLVAWTSGNVSARVPGSAELMVIKPSGVSYDDLTPDSMVVCVLPARSARSDQLNTPVSLYLFMSARGR
jgi:L-ribulose-5-phosphate 4-epimerase